MRRLVAVIAMLAPATAGADDARNALVGPLLGVRIGGREGTRGVVGVEGGVGYGVLRVNAGYEHRADRGFAYVELDPWFVVGATFGLGIDTEGEMQPVVGLWEGLPIEGIICGGRGFQRAVTVAVGYRYTGEHELFATMKAGVAESTCID
jgi:hypothetical protein